MTRAKLVSVPTGAARVAIDREDLEAADLKLGQARAIADLISCAEVDGLYDDTLGFSAHAVVQLVAEARELIRRNKPVTP